MEQLATDAWLLRGYALTQQETLLLQVAQLVAHSPFRRMFTPSGHQMSVAMTNAGQVGWITDRNGYRYVAIDPLTEQPWPQMPASFEHLAHAAAAHVGFDDFQPDACLINRYEPGARMSLHCDQDERDAQSPIVSVSLGVPAKFIWGGLQRADKTRRMLLESGDVVVWGNKSRFAYHGVAPLAEAEHPLTRNTRINLTFRRAR